MARNRKAVLIPGRDPPDTWHTHPCQPPARRLLSSRAQYGTRKPRKPSMNTLPHQFSESRTNTASIPQAPRVDVEAKSGVDGRNQPPNIVSAAIQPPVFPCSLVEIHETSYNGGATDQ
ncbi:hypothetical protein ACRALDRAFT_213239 [Sodiomyces alcalophilus JCM 7366]|uniref:uncharacterized protein n=1 Tax=Sodiomyces alcalophilus JCM 7366 TaxID=591952 RepID=UPI0039B56C56